LEDCVGRKVVIGMRPEHLTLVKTKGSSLLSVELDLVETLGSEALLHTHVSGVPFVIKAETNGTVEHLHQVSEVSISSDLIKVFDKETGLAYGHPGSQ
jgi:multiple sugar transport system ATP-binding protein